MIFTVLWVLWIAAFVVIEGAALTRVKAGATLSQHVWQWFDVKNTGGRWTAKRYALVVFLVWLLGHLAFGMWA